MPGLTTAGLEISTLADLLVQVRSAWTGEFGVSVDVSDRSPDGQLIGVATEPIALLWEVLEAIVSSQDPRKATGAFLDAICALTGTTRIPASFSAVTLTLTGTPTTTVPTGSLVSTQSTGQQFATTADFVGLIAALTAWIGSTSYATGDRRTNASNVYLCITPGVSASSGGPITTAADITDGTVHWRFLGAGSGAVDVKATATQTGPLIAVSGDLTQIDTPVGGWSGAINILDATLGRVAMSDAALRVLREQEIAKPGTSPADAVRAAMLDVDADTSDPVTACTVFVNNTDVTDGDGLGPHSIEPMVRGGSSQAIWDALLANVAAGIRTHGTQIGTSVDTEGVAQTMAFSRVTEIPIYVAVTLKKNPGTYPADGDAQVKEAIAAYGNALDDGADIVSAAVLAQVFKVTGVTDCNLPFIDIVVSPVTTTTITITKRQRGVWDTTRVSVTTSDFTP